MLFGPETRGLPESVLAETGSEHCLHLPMADASRSLNLSNTVAVGLYEAWRQLGFTNRELIRLQLSNATSSSPYSAFCSLAINLATPSAGSQP